MCKLTVHANMPSSRDTLTLFATQKRKMYVILRPEHVHESLQQYTIIHCGYECRLVRKGKRICLSSDLPPIPERDESGCIDPPQ